MTDQQLALDFDAPYQRHSPTSKAAAEQIEPTAGTLRRMVLEAIREKPSTDHELQEALGLEGSTERPRRREVQQAGLIEDSGDRRPTPSGRLAVVWRATR